MYRLFYGLTFLTCVALTGTSLPCAAQTLIMPIGDSVTWGFDGGDESPDHINSLQTGGYRDPLYTDLTTGSDPHDVQFVGANTENASPNLLLNGDAHHNGYNGYTIANVDDNLTASTPVGSDSNNGGFWLSGSDINHGQDTNIILLQIGSNDIQAGPPPLMRPSPSKPSSPTFARTIRPRSCW